jgi:acetyltransferase-like isoleucine patch superfamily enzyme
MVAVYGFNHGFSRVDRPIYTQVSTVTGIKIGDDVWIGTNAVVLDGCQIGSHSVVAAGAVVTKSFPEYSIVAGNPARRVRDRRESTPLSAQS